MDISTCALLSLWALLCSGMLCYAMYCLTIKSSLCLPAFYTVNPLLAIKLVVPLAFPWTVAAVVPASCMMRCATASMSVIPSSDIRYAASPATCGLAMDVPLSVWVAVTLSIPTLCTLTPGAKTSTKRPKLLKEARVSVRWSMAPTVMAPSAEAGESLAARARVN